MFERDRGGRREMQPLKAVVDRRFAPKKRARRKRVHSAWHSLAATAEFSF